MDESIDWRERYNSLKKSYDALYAVRKTSIESDIAVLESRLQEHLESYNSQCKSIEGHNSNMKQLVNDLDEMKEGIRKMKIKINDLRTKIGTKDSILRVLVSFPIFNIRLKKPGLYYVRVDTDEEDIRFYLSKERTTITYTPATTMPKYFPDVLQKQCVLDNMKLRDLAEKINMHFLNQK